MGGRPDGPRPRSVIRFNRDAEDALGIIAEIATSLPSRDRADRSADRLAVSQTENFTRTLISPPKSPPMLSRVAESTYWMGRQVERAENMARFLEVTLELTLEQSEYLIDPWSPLVQASGDEEWFDEQYGVADAENVTHYLAFNDAYHSSMLTCLRAARHNAKSIREMLSTEVFEELNRFYHFVENAAKDPNFETTAGFFDEVRHYCIRWAGVIDTTMIRDQTWQFLTAGRMLERADKTSRIMDVKYYTLLPRVYDVGTAVDDLQWSSLLSNLSGFEAYRRKYHLIDLSCILKFLITDRSFSRSIFFCVDRLHECIVEIERECGANRTTRSATATLEAKERIGQVDIESLLGGVHEYVDAVQNELNHIGDCLVEDYFAVSGSTDSSSQTDSPTSSSDDQIISAEV